MLSASAGGVEVSLGMGSWEETQGGGPLQEWTPEYVNGVFGRSFENKFGRLTAVSTDLTPEQVINRLHDRLSDAKTNNDSYYLTPDESNLLTALRPIEYEVRVGDITSTRYFVDPSTITNSRQWGNPGTIDTITGVPKPITYIVGDYANNRIVRIHLTIYFQSLFAGN